MELKIIGKSVVPDRIVLFEGDTGGKSLVFSIKKINDGISIAGLTGYLEIERDGGGSDRFLLEKTVGEEEVYFTLEVNSTLTQTEDILSSQLSFENEDKSIVYKTKVFFIEVKYSVDGDSSFEQILPSVITSLENKLTEAVAECNDVKNSFDFDRNELENALQNNYQLKEVQELETESKEIVGAINEINEKVDNIEIERGSLASGVSYDNAVSQLESNNVQDAIDEVNDSAVKRYHPVTDYGTYFYGVDKNSGERVIIGDSALRPNGIVIREEDNHIRIPTGAPPKNNNAVSKQYVDDKSANALNKSGGTMTGALYLSGNPTSSNQAATKNYVDAYHSASETTISNSTYFDNSIKVIKCGKMVNLIYNGGIKPLSAGSYVTVGTLDSQYRPKYTIEVLPRAKSQYDKVQIGTDGVVKAYVQEAITAVNNFQFCVTYIVD